MKRSKEFGIALLVVGLLAGGPAWGRGGGGAMHGGGAGMMRGGGAFQGGGNFQGGGSFHGGGNFHGGGSFHGGGFSNGHVHHGHGHGSVVIYGAGGWWGWGWPWYPYPAVWYPPWYPAGTYDGSVSYIEQGQGYSSDSAPAGYWYYCNNPQGYYPTINECPGGWQLVPPRPPEDLK